MWSFGLTKGASAFSSDIRDEDLSSVFSENRVPASCLAGFGKLIQLIHTVTFNIGSMRGVVCDPLVRGERLKSTALQVGVTSLFPVNAMIEATQIFVIH